MTSGFQFWDGEIWSFIVTVALLFGAMLLANLLRRQIRFLRRSLIPSAVLGGFLILLMDSLYKRIFGHSMFSLSTLEALTYHGLGLGFVALAWRHLDGVKGKEARRDVFNTSTVTVGGYLIQALVGLLITLVLSYLLGSFAAGGLLLPMGYGQGPGQAFNWGNNYQNLYGFVNGSSFGLTVAAMGFVSACVGGVFYLNKMRLAGDHRAQLENAEEIEDLSAEHITGNGEIPLSESMDKLTVQFGYVFLTYLAAYGSMWLLYHFLLEPAGGFCMNTINPLLWGFNFLVGTAWAILFKSIGNKLRAKGVINRVYTNNFMLNRISGLMFDIMVVASIAAIDLSAFRHREFWLPLLLICIAGALITYCYVRWICKRLFPNYSDEMFLAMYGMLTGTASTGIILLREIDPLYRTPTSHNLIYQNLWSIVLGAPMLLLMGVAARSRTMTWVCFGICTALFAFILVLQFRDALFRKKKES
jgi:ESS family glutamate:Na+ symporter